MYQPANLLTQQGDARGFLKPSLIPPPCDLCLLSSVQINLERLDSIHGESGRVHVEVVGFCKFYFLPVVAYLKCCRA